MPKFDSPTLNAAAQERPLRRLDGNSRPVVLAALIATLLAFAASWTLSFHGQYVIAQERLHLGPVLGALLPLGVDLWVLVFSAGVVVSQARGQSARLPWALVWAWTVVSAALNGLAAFDAAGGNPDLSAFTAAAIGVLFAGGVLAGTEQLTRLMVAPVEDRERAAALARVADRGLLGAAPGKRTQAEREDLAETVRAMAEAGASRAQIQRELKLSAAAVRNALGPAPSKGDAAVAALPEFSL